MARRKKQERPLRVVECFRKEATKVCQADCFLISTTWNATANPRFGFGPNFEVTKKQAYKCRAPAPVGPGS